MASVKPVKSSGQYVLVRAEGAGVLAGYLDELDVPNACVILTGARHCWSWSAPRLCTADLAELGPAGGPANKFSAPVSRVRIFNVLEVLDVPAPAEKLFLAVPSFGVDTK